MMNDDDQHDDEPQRKNVGRPFAKGDSRINRGGRPRHFDTFRKLAQRISHEKVIGPDGDALTRAESLLRSWSKSKCPQLQLAFVQYAYGAPPTKIETTGLEDKPTLILHWAHELDKKFGETPVRERILPDSTANGEGTLRPSLPDAD